MEDISTKVIVVSLGFVLGIVFGATAQRTNFCTMGALSDIVFMGVWNRFRAWMLALAIVMIAAQWMHLTGVIDLGKSIYLSANLGWAGAIIGGLMFGFGMTLAGGCGNKTLVRLGAGNMKSLVVFLILGIFAYMTLRGLIGLARVELEAATVIDLKAAGFASQSIPHILATLFGAAQETMSWAVTGIAAAALLIFCFKDRNFRSSPTDIAAGIIIGGVVAAAWYVTGVIGFDEFEPTQLESFSFVNPSGNSIQYLMTFTGATINFGIATVGGVITGAFLMAKMRGEFHIESFTAADDFLRHISGAALMGTGGIMALGCTIGQGITGMSTLALGSLIALASIILGGVWGLKSIEEGGAVAGLKAIFARS
ncbi:MAG: YeeE/YedE family protein [Rhodospirillales bacterium]|nr:YeeE/YedE family protein [Rhodospirillales bacterium]